MACRALGAQPGLRPVPPVVQSQSPNHWATRDFQYPHLIHSPYSPVTIRPSIVPWCFSWSVAKFKIACHV